MPNNKIIDLERLSRFKAKLDIELDKKANVDGNYPTMTVGSADSLTPYGENSGAEDNTSFVFQSTGGSSDVGSKAYLRELRGNSVAFNQLIKNGNFADTSNWTADVNTSLGINNNIAKLTVTTNGYGSGMQQNTTNYCVKDHKYLIRATCRASASNVGIRFTQYSYGPGVTILNSGNVAIGTNWTQFGVIATASNTGSGATTWRPACIRNNGTSVIDDWLEIKDLIVVDLTLMFGAGNEPTSVLEFNRLFPKPYYEYNAGELLSCKVNGIKNVGYNAWDEETELGAWNTTTGEEVVENRQLRAKNDTKVIPGQTYTMEYTGNVNGVSIWAGLLDENKNIIDGTTWGNAFSRSNNFRRIAGQNIEPTGFVIPGNARYIRFYITIEYGNVYQNNVCLHLTWDGSRTGYEEHEEWQYNLPNIELKSAVNAYDVLYSTGGGKRRIGVVDLGTLNYAKVQTANGFCFYGALPTSKLVGASVVANLLCQKYIADTYGRVYNNTNDKTIARQSDGQNIVIYDSAYQNATATDFKSAMSGVMLYYELTTETDITTEENPGWANPQDIDDFGTQEFLYDSNIDIPIPQGNDFFYPVDYKAFIDSLGGREDIEYAADQVVSQTQLTQALSTFLSSISGYDATKTQTLKNVNGVFQWVDD